MTAKQCRLNGTKHKNSTEFRGAHTQNKKRTLVEEVLGRGLDLHLDAALERELERVAEVVDSVDAHLGHRREPVLALLPAEHLDQRHELVARHHVFDTVLERDAARLERCVPDPSAMSMRTHSVASVQTHSC